MQTWALAALLIATHAQEATPEIKAQLAKGEEVESVTKGDLNGDGVADIVLIGRSEESRTVKAMLRLGGKLVTVGTLKLDSFPLGPADVTITKGVLRITDLVGGTTAVNTVYRYRLLPGARPRMRLIGIDATLYSRTYAHDGFELSWNLLTGDQITRDMKLNKKGGDAAYDPIIEKKGKKVSKPLFMEDTPDPNALVGWGEK